MTIIQMCKECAKASGGSLGSKIGMSTCSRCFRFKVVYGVTQEECFNCGQPATGRGILDDPLCDCCAEDIAGNPING